MKDILELEDLMGLYNGMRHGVIFCTAIYDKNNNMVDCCYRDMNNAYEKFANLKRETTIGRKASEVLPVTEHEWFSTFGEVVRTGKPKFFEMYVSPAQKYYSVFAYRSKKDNFVAIFEDITKRKTNEIIIKDREAYLEALNKISELSFDSVSAVELQNFVEIIGKAANASRTYIFKNHRNEHNELLLSQVAEYVAPGIKPEIDNPDLQNLNYHDWIPRWEKLLKSGKMISGKVADFPENEKALLEPQDIKSLIVIPVIVDKTFWGFLGFDNCVDDRDWSTNDIKYLKTAARRLENAITLVAKQELLEAERNRFKALSEATYEAIFISENGICIEANEAASTMFGYSYKELIGIFGTDVIADESKELVKNNMLSGLDEPYEAIAQRKDGSKFYAEFQGRMYNYNNKKVRITAVRDITKHKNQEQEIKKFKTISDKSMYGNAIADLQGNILYINDYFAKAHGYTVNELIGKNLAIFHSEKQLPVAIEINKELIENGSYSAKEIWHVHKDGTEFPMLMSGVLHHDLDGKPNFLSASAIDISKQKEANKQIRLLSQVVKTTSQSVVITDLEGNIVFVNEALMKSVGFEIESEIIGKSFYSLTDEKGVRKLKQVILPKVLNKSSFYEDEINIRKNENTFYPAEIYGSFIPDEAGKPEFLVAMFSDITKRKMAERELILAKEKAEESNRLKTAFIRNMSHEIRTPLNGITGFIRILQDSDIEEEDRQEYIDIIDKSSERLISTVTDIMEISKIEAGLVKASFEVVPVNEILDEVFGFFSLEAKEKGLKLMQLPSLSDDEATVLTDNQKLNEILTNLVKNAIKFTDKGSVTFGYKLKTDTLEFYVKDTGIGIPVNRQQAVFNRFEQADIEDTRAFEGSGLGLAIVKSYVEMLGGKIWLRSEVGVGSEFMFTIPYKTKTGITKKQKQQNVPENRQGDLKDLTVLIAEDEEVNIKFFGTIFENTFKQIIYVGTGQEAIDACINNPEIDLILMDIKMPVMGGYSATRAIRKFNKEVIIIAQTAFGLEGDREKAIEAGCNDYISKPINKNLLFEKIKFYF
jgi:PAS domain S-box-containing protein